MGGMLFGMVLVVGGFIALAVYVVVSRGRQVAALADRGVPVTATVSMKRHVTGGADGASRKRIGYRYTAPDGRAFERFASIGVDRFRALAEGDPLPIYILPDDPGTCAPAWIVDPARGALAKRGR